MKKKLLIFVLVLVILYLVTRPYTSCYAAPSPHERGGRGPSYVKEPSERCDEGYIENVTNNRYCHRGHK